MDENDYVKLIEAAIFMSPTSISIADISAVTGIASAGKVKEIVKGLMDTYKAGNTSLEIFEIDSKYVFGLKEPYASKVSRLASGPDITKGALRLLAYVSKNNGIVQSELVKYFGYATYDFVKELTEKGFIETKKFGRSKKVITTSKFKEYFNS